MSRLIVPLEGQSYLLDRVTGRVAADPLPWTLLLWQNDIDPDEETVAVDLTAATFSGYSPISLSAANWTAPAVVDGQSVSYYTDTPRTWSVGSGPQTVYGYGITALVIPVLLIVERWDTPQVVEDGGVIGVLPRFLLGTLPLE